MPKIHIHSDCEFFSGSENMLVNLFNSAALQDIFQLSFSYRSTPQYEEGLRQRTQLDFPVFPLDIPNFDSLPLPSCLVKFRLIVFLVRQLVYWPLLLREVVLLRAVLKKVRPDIVHINNGGYPGALSCRAMALAARAAGVKRVVMVVNNLAVPYDRVSRWLDKAVDGRVAAAVDVFVTGSAAAGRRLAEVLRLPEHQIRAVHNGIRVRMPHASEVETRRRLGLTNFDGMLVGVVALHESRKGHCVLLEAMTQLLLNEGIASRLKVIIEGDGPLRMDLMAQVVTLGLTDMVSFVGTEDHVFDFMSVMDVLVLPSVRDEDFPNVILEAMLLSKPVIATRLAGIPEQVVDGVTGLLVQPADVNQLAQAIQRMVEDPNGRRAMGQAAKERFNQFFSSAIAQENYLHLYEELINL